MADMTHSDFVNGFKLNNMDKEAFRVASDYLNKEIEKENDFKKLSEFAKSALDNIKNNAIGDISSDNSASRNLAEFMASRVDLFLTQFVGEALVQRIYTYMPHEFAEKIAKMPKNIGIIITLGARKMMLESIVSHLDKVIELLPNNMSSAAKLNLASLTSTISKHLDEVSKHFTTELEAAYNKYGARILFRGMTTKQILSEVVHEGFGEFLGKGLNAIFSVAGFVKLLIDGVNSEHPEKTAASWLNFATGLFETWSVKGTLFPHFIENLPRLGRTELLGSLSRGVMVGIATDLAFHGGYLFGEKLIWGWAFEKIFGKELYEMDWYMEYSDKFIPFLLGRLDKNKTEHVMAISQLLTRAFRGKDGGILELETLGEILGNEDYTEMDYAKVVGIFTELYALLAENKPPVPARKDINNGSWALMDVILNLDDVKKTFTNPYGRRLVTINPGDSNLFKLAKQDDKGGMAYRYALKHLHPFVIEDGSLFTEQNLGGKLNEYELLKLYKEDDASTHSGMTDEYIVKRIQMLQSISGKENHLTLKQAEPAYSFKDLELGITRDNSHMDISATNEKRKYPWVIFGSDEDNELDIEPADIPENSADYLFAGKGNDKLNGRGGNDYLEGGPGSDTYYIEGHDTVFDADSKGELRFGKDKAEYFIPETPNSQDSWISSDSNGEPDGKFRAVRDGQNLVITSVANEANKVTVKDYFSGRNTLDGALDLHDVAPKPEPQETKEYTITPKYNHVHNEYNLGTDSYLVQGSLKNDLIWANSALPGKSGYGLVTQTGAGNDIVYGSLYPDIIEGGADTDVLLGSAPKTTLTGKQKTLDANLMSGNEGRDFIMGGFGNDIIHAGNIDEHLQLQERKEQGDWVNGAEGNDALYGSAAQDIVQGGAGTDTIRGGAGNDLLVGDSNAMVYAHIDRNYGTYLPVTHIHSYNLKENKWNRIEQVQISNRLIDKSAEWKLEIDHDKQDYFITRDYHDWENNASLVAEEEGAGDDIEGGTGDDMLIGQRGDDVLDGQGGNDIVFGDDNRDKSIVGNDHLRGGSGSDTLIGGKGADSYYFFREELQPEEGKPAPTDIVIDDGRGDGNKMDEIFLDAFSISSLKWNYDKERKIWSDDENGWQITKKGSELNITHKDYPGVIRVLDYAYGDYELRLSERKNGPFPDPEPAEPVPPQPVPPQPEPPKPEQPKPEQPKPEQPQAPTAGKPLAAQSIHEKDKLSYTLAEDAFHTANKDDKLSYSARLADGKPLPQWLNFDAATRTFSGTPGNDDVGVLDIEISVQGKGGAASQHLALNVINVNDAPYKSAPFSLHSANSDGEVKCNSRIYIRDIDKGDKLTFSAEMRDGQPLPSWLSIDSETGVLTGSLPFVRGGKDYFVRITATDKAGESASGVLMIRGKFPQIGLIGSDKDDVLKGIVRSAYGVNIKIHGYGGNDTIVGGNLHDDLYGDKGNDVLDGGSGNDIYHFARGDGNDIINNHDTGARRHDSIDFSDMNRSDFDIRREGNNLVLRSKDGNNQITVTNHFQPGWQIDSIYFADGMTLDHDAINSLTGAQNPPQGNYTDPAAQALQMNQAIASLNSQAQPLDALATPDLQPRPLLAAGNP